MSNKKYRKPETSTATRIMQIVFAVFSILLILTMILSAFVIPR